MEFAAHGSVSKKAAGSFLRATTRSAADAPVTITKVGVENANYAALQKMAKTVGARASGKTEDLRKSIMNSCAL